VEATTFYCNYCTYSIGIYFFWVNATHSPLLEVRNEKLTTDDIQYCRQSTYKINIEGHAERIVLS
jgi:hypothetical protein